ncbi:DUF1330 domain-containing protein [Paracoccus niistensis]|uniref:DUF1330 domain-containing protein n=1 Tax=Paracoccus niistensis TaxID=632935 RepID=A0ABV6HZI6_9RHOB
MGAFIVMQQEREKRQQDHCSHRSGRIEALEGEAPDAALVALIEFPPREAAMGFAADPDYAPFGEARKSGSVSNFYLIDDTDVAGSIPYLGKG